MSFHWYSEEMNQFVRVILQNEKASEIFSDHLLEFGNLVFIALCASQFLNDQMNFFAMIIGVVILLICYVMGGIIIMKGTHEI